MAITPARKIFSTTEENSLTVEKNLAGRIMVILSGTKIFPTLSVLSLQPSCHLGIKSRPRAWAKIELERPHFLLISLTSRAINNYSLQAKFRYSGVSLVDAGPVSSFFEIGRKMWPNGELRCSWAKTQAWIRNFSSSHLSVLSRVQAICGGRTFELSLFCLPPLQKRITVKHSKYTYY
jgi:hypothetical protein